MDESAYNNRSGKNALTAGLAGAAIGAVGVMAAYALSDRKTRDKINAKIDDAQDMSKQKLHEMRQKARSMREKATNATKAAADTAEEMADQVANDTETINKRAKL